MLTLVLALSASSLVLKGESTCPSLPQVLGELLKLGPRTEAEPGWVELKRDGDTAYVLLVADDGTVLATRRVGQGGACEALAARAAYFVADWELPTTPPAPVPLAPVRVEEGELGRGTRMLGSLLGAAVGAVIPALVTLVAPQRSNRLGGLLVFEVLGGPPLLGLAAWLGHRAAGGLGHYGAAVGGAFVGIAAALATLIIDNREGDWFTPREPARVVSAALLAVALPALTLELSDLREREALAVAVMPVAGGAGVSVGGRF